MPGDDASRRLLAVMVTDMVASTRTLTTHGPAVTAALRRVHDQLLTGRIEEHGGWIVETNGDGVVALFPSASATVRAASAIHLALRDHARRAGTVAPIDVRIGVSVGEVLPDGTRRDGDAIAEAARLEPLAEPGTTLTSSAVRALVRDVADSEFGPPMLVELAGFPGPRPVHTVIAIESGGPVPLPRSARSVPSMPIVGSERSLDALRRRFDALDTEGAAVVTLTGPSGAGKSTLLGEFARECHATGAIVLGGSPDPELDLPYQAIAAAVRPAAPIDDALGAAIHTDGSSTPLSRLFPTTDTADVGPMERSELFGAVAGLFRRLADRRPTLLLLDDMHWAQASTASLLGAIVRAAADTRLLIVMTMREDEMPTDHPVFDVLTSARSAGLSTAIRLAPLTDDDVLELASTVAGRGLDASEVRLALRVRSDCGGNPFYASEVLRDLARRGEAFAGPRPEADTADLDVLQVPPTVRDLIQRRVAALGPDAIRLLGAGAVAGPTFDAEIAAEAIGLDALDALDIAEAAVRAALCEELLDGRRLAFSHDIIRQALAAPLSRARTARIHRGLAEALERRSDVSPDELARHWIEAGTNPDRAVHHLAVAATRDERALAWESAVDRRRRILDFLEARVETAPALADAWLAYALALREIGDPSYRDAAARAGRIARSVGDGQRIADATIAFLRPGGWWVDALRTEERVIGLGEDALALLAEDDPRRVRVNAAMATVSPFAHTPARRVELAETAWDLARHHRDPDLQIAALSALHHVHWAPHHIQRRLDIAAQLVELGLRAESTTATFLGRFFTHLARFESGRTEGARSELADLAHVASATGTFWFEYLVRRATLGLDIAAEAQDPSSGIETVYEMGRESFADALGARIGQLAVLRHNQGRFAEVLEPLQAADEATGHQFAIYGASVALALAASGDIDAATDRLEAVDPRPNVDYLWLPSLQVYAEAVWATGRADLAAPVLDELAPFEEHFGIGSSGSYVWAPVSLSLAYLAGAMGRHDLVDAYLQRNDDVAVRMPIPFARRAADQLRCELETRG